MKTTIEIADDLFERVQQLARSERATFRALTEKGLRLVLQRKRLKSNQVPPLVTVGGRGVSDEFKNRSWVRIRNEIYETKQ